MTSCVATLVRLLHRNRTNRIYIHKSRKICYEVLAHVIMEAEQSHTLLSASGAPGEQMV